jgi:hypothetical protein
MRKETYMIIILIISIIGLSTGFYLKFIKSYINDIQGNGVENGESIQRPLRLGENIDFLKELNKSIISHGIESKENDIALKRLKTINTISFTIMILSSLAFLWAIQKIIKINRS